ncbi:hypothetical protein Nmel_011789 [Mimus melanotis]
MVPSTRHGVWPVGAKGREDASWICQELFSHICVRFGFSAFHCSQMIL